MRLIITDPVIDDAFASIRNAVGTLPILESETQEQTTEGKSADASTEKIGGGARRILPDGTYATESALVSNAKEVKQKSKKPAIRRFLLEGDFFLGSVLASTLLKLIVRLRCGLKVKNGVKLNQLSAESMLTLSSIIRLGKSSIVTTKIDENNYERIIYAIKEISKPVSNIDRLILEEGRKSFRNVLKQEESKKNEADLISAKENLTLPNKQIEFRLFQSKGMHRADSFDFDLVKATHFEGDTELKSSKLDRIVQLTGYSDPIYAEAYVNIHQYDITIDVLVVNQTTQTFQNLILELSTLGDLKLVERPGSFTLAPRGFLSIKATIKVSSSDNGVIFGNIVYDHGSDTNTIVLNSINIDIMEYIKPAECTDLKVIVEWTFLM
jgi:coatomer subunit beta